MNIIIIIIIINPDVNRRTPLMLVQFIENFAGLYCSVVSCAIL